MGRFSRVAPGLLAAFVDGYRIGTPLDKLQQLAAEVEGASMTETDSHVDVHVANSVDLVLDEDEFRTDWGSCGAGVFHFDLRSDENHSVALEFVRSDSQPQILSFVGYSWNARLTDPSLRAESTVTWTPEPIAGLVPSEVEPEQEQIGHGDPDDVFYNISQVFFEERSTLGEDILLGVSHIRRIPAAPQSDVCASCHSPDAIEFTYKNGTTESFSGGVYYPEDIVQRSIVYGSMTQLNGGINPATASVREVRNGGANVAMEDMIGRANARCLRWEWCLSYTFNPDQNLCEYRCTHHEHHTSCNWQCSGPRIYYFDVPANPVSPNSNEWFGPECSYYVPCRGYEPTPVASWISGGFAPASVRETGINAGADYHQRFLDTRSTWGWRGFFGGWSLAAGGLAALLGPAILVPEALLFTTIWGAGFGGSIGALTGIGTHYVVDPAEGEALRQERRLNAIASETLFEQMRCSSLFVECSPMVLVLRGDTCPPDV